MNEYQYTLVIFRSGTVKPQHIHSNDFTSLIEWMREENQPYAAIWRNSDNRMLTQRWVS